MPPDRPISVLVKPVSADCNLACRYCFYLPKAALYPDSPTHRMSPEVLEALVSQQMRLAARFPGQPATFCWQGGEPTLAGLDFYRRVVALQQTHGRDGQAVANAFQTNGLLINDDWAAFFAQYNVLVGVSLDGPEAIHDHYRRSAAGQPSHARVMRAIERLRAHAVEFNILTMVTPLSAARPDEVWDFMMAHDLRFLQFIPCAERDPATGEIADYSVSPRAYGEFLCRIFDRWIAGGWRQTYVRLFNDLLAMAAGEPSPSCTFQDHCGDYVVVEFNGDVYTCDFFVQPDCYLGNLQHTPLEHLLRTSAYQSFAQRKRTLGAQCRACEWVAACHGGCPKYRLLKTAEIASPDYFCDAYKMLFAHTRDALLPIVRRLSAADAPVARPGRNAPCPCGSGKKYKRCCGRAG
jgi:uncharacterized protein